MTNRVLLAAVLAGTAATFLTPAAAHATTAASYTPCLPTRPANAFYEGGRIASVPVTVPESRCTTIAVSHIRDVANPADRCQTFLLALHVPGSDPTYTEPVRACSTTPAERTVLATDVPDGTVFQVLYQIEYMDPEFQQVSYKVWR